MKRTKVTDVLSLAFVVAVIVAVVSYAILSTVREITVVSPPHVEVLVAGRGPHTYGSTVTLLASVKGISPPYELQWQYSDGEAWKELPGERGMTYEYTLTRENCGYTYRVLVSAKENEPRVR